MAVPTMIGIAKETIQFGILVFLETQEMNLRGNLQDIKVACLVKIKLFFYGLILL